MAHLADTAGAARESESRHPRHHGHGDFEAHEEHHEGAPEWLISFADNVALMMGFFVVLLAMNMVKPTAGGIGGQDGDRDVEGGTPEWLDAVIAIREAFNNPVDIRSTNPQDTALVQRLRERRAQLYPGPGESPDDGVKGSERDVRSIRRTERFGAGGGLQFATNSAELSESARDAARQIAELFAGLQTVLEVRGHCSAAEAFGQDERGMRLSYERALAVARELAARGISWERIRVTACADTERVAQIAYNEDEQQTNQRVEVVERTE